MPAVTDGRILGHEAVGTVEAVGSGVKDVRVGESQGRRSSDLGGGQARPGKDGQQVGWSDPRWTAGNFSSPRGEH
jgi:D-arabinose 1-dehydrogenase-like Zn-dependent alcohol dehydrogenase